jgi:transcriptional regulator with XRE-family HTH domain
MPAPRIGPQRPRRVYLAEHRQARGLTQRQLAERLGVTDITVSRWELGRALLNTDVMAAIAEAFGDMEPQDLYRHPDTPSADALLRDQPAEVQDQAIRVIKAIIGAIAPNPLRPRA